MDPQKYTGVQSFIGLRVLTITLRKKVIPSKSIARYGLESQICNQNQTAQKRKVMRSRTANRMKIKCQISEQGNEIFIARAIVQEVISERWIQVMEKGKNQL